MSLLSVVNDVCAVTGVHQLQSVFNEPVNKRTALEMLALANEIFKRGTVKLESLDEKARAQVQEKIHMDIKSNISHLPAKILLTRGAIFFGWMVGFLMSMALIGLIPTVPLFVIAFMRTEGREPWRIVLPLAATMCVFIYFLFDQLLAIPWPPSVLGDFVPSLKGVVPSV
jgi:hypothetical protein